jgi:hypothetical protein
MARGEIPMTCAFTEYAPQPYVRKSYISSAHGKDSPTVAR